jgi:hypothetical protein
MSAPTATVARPVAATRMAWLPVALVFMIGTTIGVVGTASVIALSPGDTGGSVAQPAVNTQLTRLLGNMDEAAERGNARLFAEYRQDLIQLIGAAGVAEYERLRGNDSPTFHYSDNSGGI